MTAFTLDTSGVVDCRFPGSQFADLVRWSDLSPFVQGTMEVAARELWERLPWVAGGETSAERVAFSRWSPEALALILRDCEAADHLRPGVTDQGDRAAGSRFWEHRQMGSFERFPPQTPYLADDGKVHLREAA